jgi:hypothetical protein
MQLVTWTQRGYLVSIGRQSVLAASGGRHQRLSAPLRFLLRSPTSH